MIKKLKEKISNNEGVILIKKMWDNKRYRSLLLFVLYFIFFFAIIAGLRDNYKKNEEVIYEEEDKISVSEIINNQYQELKDYYYRVSINDEIIIDGNIQDSINNFSYNKKNYSIVANNVYQKNNDDLKKVDINKNSKVIVPIESLMAGKILDNIINLAPISEDDSTEYKAVYELSGSYFDIEEDYTFQVTISGNEEIENIVIDLSEYAKKEYIIKVELSLKEFVEEGV